MGLVQPILSFRLISQIIMVVILGPIHLLLLIIIRGRLLWSFMTVVIMVVLMRKMAQFNLVHRLNHFHNLKSKLIIVINGLTWYQCKINRDKLLFANLFWTILINYKWMYKTMLLEKHHIGNYILIQEMQSLMI